MGTRVAHIMAIRRRTWPWWRKRLMPLRARAGARRVVAVGHSGGAATITDSLALHPGTIDAAVLLACARDLATMRSDRRPLI